MGDDQRGAKDSKRGEQQDDKMIPIGGTTPVGCVHDMNQFHMRRSMMFEYTLKDA